MKVSRFALCLLAGILLVTITGSAFAQDVTSSPSSLSFPNTYVGLDSGSKSITVTANVQDIVIISISFSCPGFGISSGVAPFSFGATQTLTHYSIFFQPTVAQAYSCNFIMTMNDGTTVDVPLTGTALSTTAVASVTPSTLSFPNQPVGTTSAAQTVTINNTGSTSVNLTAIDPAPASFTTSAVTLPYVIDAGKSLQIQVYYTPGEVTSGETGSLDLSYNSLPDNGTALTGNGVADTTLAVSNNPTLPQATQSAAYEYQLATSGGVGPYTWSLASGSSLPSGLTLSSSGEITGTLASSVTTGNYSFTVQVTDSSTGNTANDTLTIGVFANLADNCNDISYNDPVAGTPLVAISDLGTGLFEGYEGGLYPNGANVRPSAQNSAGIAFAQGIVPLNSSGVYSPTGKYVLMAVGESTLQNEFNRFLPIANSDPTKNPYLVLVNGAQGGATPNNLTSTTSFYWNTVLYNYLPQNGVTSEQVVAIVMEDTDGIATGTFPSDITALQSQYETMMNTMLTLFPNLKLVYFSSRVYGGYSNGVGSPDNPEPYAYEVGWAAKWAIGDQINGNANLNYNPANGPVEAPWMSWGPYYWSNGMLGRADGLIWDCADFSADGTHPSSEFGQYKVASQWLQFLKSDATTMPWYLTPIYGLTDTGGSGQTGNPGTTLPIPLTAEASNINGGAGISGVSVTFTDGGAGGTFNPITAVTNSSGIASTSYTLPTTGSAITVTASATGYNSTTFTETVQSETLSPTSGSNQTGAPGTTLPLPLVVTATNNGVNQSGVLVNFTDNGAGGQFTPTSATTGSNGQASTSYTLPSTAQTVTINATSSGYSAATFTETAQSASLSVNAGNNQTGNVGTALPTPLTVLATSNGNPVSGVSVTFSDNNAGGSFNPTSATTGSNGLASTTYTLPTSAKNITITASSTGYTSATFSETAAVQTLAQDGGNNQTAMGGTALPTPLTVLATSNGNPVSGLSVTFSDGGAGGSFNPPTVATSGTGTASSTYTLPTTAKAVTITVTGTGFTSATFTETSTPVVTSLSVVSGGKQTGEAGTTLPKPLVIKAKNASGLAVSGAPITFSDGLNGTFSPNPATTGTNGEVSVTYTLPTSAKTVTATATDGTIKVNVTEYVTVGPQTDFTIAQGNLQQAPEGKPLPKKLIVLLTDQYKNPISGVTVTFTDNGAGGTFSTTMPVTAANGEASVTYTTGKTPGTITISATTTLLGPLNFSETVIK
jgi:hypothetical protein